MDPERDPGTEDPELDPDPAELPQPSAPPLTLKPVPAPRRGFARWLLAGLTTSPEGHELPAHHHTYPWWKVMCLTGVDYFSTLGYQPGIAFLAAGALSPIATMILVAVTLFVALPVYRQVAAHSPHGQGSIAMLEELLPRWRGKVFVLILLGFALTDFIITITLSAADATAHIVENPLVPHALHRPVLITILLVAVLGVVFLRGFHEAIGLAVSIVAVYLTLNAVVLAVSFWHLSQEPWQLTAWRDKLFTLHASPLGMAAAAVLLFPKLALGLSGFETGVAVMPLVAGKPDDKPALPAGRIRAAQRLLLTAAAIMSVFLVSSSVVTTLLIPAEAFQDGGEANGRALAYLAHHYLGHVFGTIYDVTTIVILWFAGASAMAGLLNLVPRYLPPYGMAPEWARASRPLVMVFTVLGFVVTIIFQADVDAQGGAYATGVLFLMTSASVAVTLAFKGRPQYWLYGLMTLIFGYTLTLNILERPEGIKIASFFILAIIGSSLFSRAIRSTELRVTSVQFSAAAQQVVDRLAPEAVRIIAHRPDKRTTQEYDKKEQQARDDHSLDNGEPLVFLEVSQGDASDFRESLYVRAAQVGRHHILRCTSPAIPNAIAALLLHLRDSTGQLPHAYFGWTEGNPITYVLKYLFLGEGDTAPVTREVLRKAIRNPLERPRIHVG
ncbi:MAG TPA: amino acid transporter [Vicinamibacteria bacterium]|jgi:amino acid permease